MENEATNATKKFSISAWWERMTGEPMRTKDKVIGVLGILLFLFLFYITLDANKYPALVHVVEGAGKVGVNPTDQALDFGDLSQGTSAVRRVDITNGTPMSMYIMVFKTGSISDLIKIEKNFFKLAPRAREAIEFEVYMPASATVDSKYDGRVYLFKIPVF